MKTFHILSFLYHLPRGEGIERYNVMAKFYINVYNVLKIAIISSQNYSQIVF